MTKILSIVAGSLLLMIVYIGYLYNNVQKELVIARGEVQIKEQSILALKQSITNQNDAIEKLKIDKKEKEIVFKDRIKYITKTIEVEKEVVKYLTGQEDCEKSKEILNGLFE